MEQRLSAEDRAWLFAELEERAEMAVVSRVAGDPAGSQLARGEVNALARVLIRFGVPTDEVCPRVSELLAPITDYGARGEQIRD